MNLKQLQRGALSLLLCLSGTSLWAQSVIFPQVQQPGTAVVSVADNTYTLKNDLFTVNFVKGDGTLKFGGCEKLGLLAGTEIFKVELRDGTEIPASQFTMGDVVTETLTGDPKAAKGAKRLPGQQIKAIFTHANGLQLEWRAVLRDGSHYLRTELDIKNNGTEDLAMNSITPMMYTVQNVDGEKAPAVVGNTRGAVIASDRIFAGLETPMGIQTSGATTDLETFVFQAWDGEGSWAWNLETEDIPAGIKALSQYAAGTVKASRGYLVFRQKGVQTVTFQYTNGNNRLQIVGADLVNLQGSVVASDYHFGYTGGAKENNVYSFDVPETGVYLVRFFVTNAGNGEGFNSKGTITYSGKVKQPELVYDVASTGTPYFTPEVVELPEAEVGETLPEKVFTLQEGMPYYFAANVQSAPYYLYIDATGALKASTTCDTENVNYKWTLEANGDGWNIKNGGGKYLSYSPRLTAGDAAYKFQLTDDVVVEAFGAFALYNPTSSGGKYMVTKNDGSAFDQNASAANATWCSDYVFTPCPETVGSLTASAATAADTWVSSWEGFSDWTGELPTGITKSGTVKYKDTGFYQMGTGRLDVLFDYTGGSHGLYVLGLQVVDANNNVVAQEFKNGFTGSSSEVTYSVVVPEAGAYKLRYITDYCGGGTDTNGSITITYTEIKSITSTQQQTNSWNQSWTGFAVWADAPADLKSMNKETREEIAPTSVQYMDCTYAIKAGKLSVDYRYSGGSHGLYPIGVVLLDESGNVVATDYHPGFTGGVHIDNVFKVNVPVSGIYTVRYVVDKNAGGTVTNGNITLSLTEVKSLGNLREDEIISHTWVPADWKTIDASEVPNRVNETGCTDENARVIEQQITITTAGQFSVEFDYQSGSHKLILAGVDLVDALGNIVVNDYHAGETGAADVKNSYKFDVTVPGTYTLRYFANNIESINSSGEVRIKLAVDYTLHLVASETTPIEGKWSRITTLKAGETWDVASVVGMIAPGQARRSFLAYSERERAVPWRAAPTYVSWYELNINHNNAAPGSEHLNSEESEYVAIVNAWKEQLYDKYGEAPYAFVWDDGWDKYGEWQFHSGLPNGFTPIDNIGRQMGAGQGAWLGPVGGYGTSGSYRKNYWNSTKTGGMQLSNPAYYEVFVNAVTNLLYNYGYDFRFFKFDGISGQFSSVGPDAGAVGQENAEAIIMAEKVLRSIKADVFLNTSVGTWASPFWFQFTDAVWRQEMDYGTAGNNSVDRENWITYRDRLVYQNFVQNSPLCPINTLMTHGFILTGNPDNQSDGGRGGWTASRNIDYKHVLNELRCAFACGSGMVELYNDVDLTNLINGGALWKDIADCMKWQRKNADVLPDIHWVGGNPWTGAKAEIYGWAAWNAKNAVLTLRNGANGEQSYTFTLREALDIPAYVNTTITLTKAFADQVNLSGLTEGTAINIDTELTVTLPGSSVYVFDGVDGATETADVAPIAVEVGAYEIATFCAEHATTIPSGVKAYVAYERPEIPGDENSMGVLVMEEVTDVIPANTGVVLRAEKGTYNFEYTTSAAEEVEGNLLHGYAGRAEYEVVVKPADAVNYVLTVMDDVAAFYRKDNHFKVYRNKAYLCIPNASLVKGFRMQFENADGTTDVSDVLLNGVNEKVVFDLQGRRVQHPQKGVYVIGGKKVIY